MEKIRVMARMMLALGLGLAAAFSAVGATVEEAFAQPLRTGVLSMWRGNADYCEGLG